jgi:hypothetical protein
MNFFFIPAKAGIQSFISVKKIHRISAFLFFSGEVSIRREGYDVWRENAFCRYNNVVSKSFAAVAATAAKTPWQVQTLGKKQRT